MQIGLKHLIDEELEAYVPDVRDARRSRDVGPRTRDRPLAGYLGAMLRIAAVLGSLVVVLAACGTPHCQEDTAECVAPPPVCDSDAMPRDGRCGPVGSDAGDAGAGD
jgi:hypothetical protein